jgi:hypothetical protein
MSQKSNSSIFAIGVDLVGMSLKSLTMPRMSTLSTSFVGSTKTD